MPKSVDRIPPMPRIQAIDPRHSEQSWESAPQLLAALNGARLGAWYWDIERGQISWSRGTQALFGFDPHAPLPADLEYLALLPPEGLDLKDYLASLEQTLIQQALDDSAGVVARAAERLRIRRTTLVEKMRKYGMSRREDGGDAVEPGAFVAVDNRSAVAPPGAEC